MPGSSDTEKLQEEFNKQIEQKRSELALIKRKYEFHQKFMDVMRHVIHKTIVSLNNQWRGRNKYPDGRVLRGHFIQPYTFYLQESYEYTNCGRNGVHFILSIIWDDETEKVLVWREYFKRTYDRAAYYHTPHSLMKTEDFYDIEKVNPVWVKKMVTKGVWQARKIDLVEYFGPPHPIYGYGYRPPDTGNS